MRTLPVLAPASYAQGGVVGPALRRIQFPASISRNSSNPPRTPVEIQLIRSRMNSPPAVTAPTRARNLVLFFVISLAVITYVDRVCIAQAAPQMQKDLGLTKAQMGWAFTAASLAYALFEIPGGWLGDKVGPRKVLLRVVAMWSAFTVATGWASLNSPMAKYFPPVDVEVGNELFWYIFKGEPVAKYGLGLTIDEEKLK